MNLFIYIFWQYWGLNEFKFKQHKLKLPSWRVQLYPGGDEELVS
jgi:hypothetical protein